MDVSRTQDVQKTPVGILEDHQMCREAMAKALADAGHEVRFAVGSVAEFLGALAANPVQVIVLDLAVDGGDPHAGVNLVASLREEAPQANTVVVTGFDRPELASACMAAGASGFMGKAEATTAKIVDAVAAAARGERRVPLNAVSHQGGLTASLPVGGDRRKLELLTEREREVLSCIAAGHDNLKIGAQLGIAERTVKAHVSALYRKLGAENRVQLAIIARTHAMRLPAGPAH